MTFEEQKQWTLQGEMYNDLTPELMEARRTAVELTNEYNASYGQTPEIREPILEKLLRNVGGYAFLEPGFHCEFGFNISMGKGLHTDFGCILLDPSLVEIGGYALFGPRVSIHTTKHVCSAAERVAEACFAKPVKIGNYVWVGGDVHMDHGITIGDNTIISAGDVITGDTPANVVTADVPCKMIRPITEDEKTDYSGILRRYWEDSHGDVIYIRSGRSFAEQQKGGDGLHGRGHQPMR